MSSSTEENSVLTYPLTQSLFQTLMLLCLSVCFVLASFYGLSLSGAPNGVIISLWILLLMGGALFCLQIGRLVSPHTFDGYLQFNAHTLEYKLGRVRKSVPITEIISVHLMRMQRTTFLGIVTKKSLNSSSPATAVMKELLTGSAEILLPSALLPKKPEQMIQEIEVFLQKRNRTDIPTGTVSRQMSEPQRLLAGLRLCIAVLFFSVVYAVTVHFLQINIGFLPFIFVLLAAALYQPLTGKKPLHVGDRLLLAVATIIMLRLTEQFVVFFDNFEYYWPHRLNALFFGIIPSLADFIKQPVWGMIQVIACVFAFWVNIKDKVEDMRK